MKTLLRSAIVLLLVGPGQPAAASTYYECLLSAEVLKARAGHLEIKVLDGTGRLADHCERVASEFEVPVDVELDEKAIRGVAAGDLVELWYQLVCPRGGECSRKWAFLGERNRRRFLAFQCSDASHRLEINRHAGGTYSLELYVVTEGRWTLRGFLDGLDSEVYPPPLGLQIGGLNLGSGDWARIRMYGRGEEGPRDDFRAEFTRNIYESKAISCERAAD